jgi:hypothetical protein
MHGEKEQRCMAEVGDSGEGDVGVELRVRCGRASLWVVLGGVCSIL